MIVLVHGFMVDGSLWSDVAPLLSERSRVVVPDLPLGSHRHAMADNADLSLPGMARLVADFLAALDLHQVTLVGNDTGGAVCQLVATRHPQRLARLVLTNCDAYEHCPPPVLRYLLVAARLSGVVWLLAQSLRLRPARRLPIAYGWTSHRRPPRAVEDAWVEPLRTDGKVRRDVRKLLRALSPGDTLEAADQLSGFPGPTLLAWGRPDRLFPARLAERLAADIPNCRLEWIDGARAFVPLDAPARLAEVICDFALPAGPDAGGDHAAGTGGGAAQERGGHR